GQGARQPPRNSVVASAETVTRLMYSARKKSANLSELYSVWKPPTSSPSASGRSNGARLVSPTIETTYTRNDTGTTRMNQRDVWPSTICDVDIELAARNTATNERPIATSYEIIWALERRPPSSGY